MNKQTLKALKESIAHWERLASGDRSQNDQLGTDSCALCRMFYLGQKSCHGCPVAVKTKVGLCRNTPYASASDTYWRIQLTTDKDEQQAFLHPSFLKAAKKELAFLRSLLPTTKTLTPKAVKKQTRKKQTT